MINYEGRALRKAGNGNRTVARHRQNDDQVPADFTGGKMSRGPIIGTCEMDETTAAGLDDAACHQRGVGQAHREHSGAQD